MKALQTSHDSEFVVDGKPWVRLPVDGHVRTPSWSSFTTTVDQPLPQICRTLPLPRYLTALMFLVLKIIDEIIRSDNCNSD